ncbi:MAG: putative ABC transporter permease [Coriobacteriales bacterium]|nr:putative ABC transporter permease [Coriobacteriales bacterium]
MWISRYVVWFLLYSVLGWVYESAYCTIVERKWENRGFLYGPVCPIYGFGVIGMMAAWQLVQREGIVVSAWQVFVATALGSVVLEYVTSWALEKLFHARWWDYGNMPLNINGRVCLPATILFGIMGLLVVYVLYQPTIDITSALPPELIEALSLVLVGLVSVDATLTVTALTRFAQIAASTSDSVNEHMDQFVNGVVERSSLAADTLAQEREKFERRLRSSRMGEMGVVVASAARRIRLVTPSEGKASGPARQLEKMWYELRHGSARKA